MNARETEMKCEKVIAVEKTERKMTIAKPGGVVAVKSISYPFYARICESFRPIYGSVTCTFQLNNSLSNFLTLSMTWLSQVYNYRTRYT